MQELHRFSGLCIHTSGESGDGCRGRRLCDNDGRRVSADTILSCYPMNLHHDRRQIMSDPKYKAFTALDPFFDIVQRGLAGMVDGDHYFDTIADNAVFEFRYIFPGYPRKIDSREALMALYAGYGNNISLHGADALVVHRSQNPRVVILEYEVHGTIIRAGASYDNRFISVVTIGDRRIVHWRDYMDSLAAMTALSQTP
jgi:ketosteroid isomerase-like protein